MVVDCRRHLFRALTPHVGNHAVKSVGLEMCLQQYRHVNGPLHQSGQNVHSGLGGQPLRFQGTQQQPPRLWVSVDQYCMEHGSVMVDTTTRLKSLNQLLHDVHESWIFQAAFVSHQNAFAVQDPSTFYFFEIVFSQGNTSADLHAKHCEGCKHLANCDCEVLRAGHAYRRNSLRSVQCDALNRDLEGPLVCHALQPLSTMDVQHQMHTASQFEQFVEASAQMTGRLGVQDMRTRSRIISAVPMRGPASRAPSALENTTCSNPCCLKNRSAILVYPVTTCRGRSAVHSGMLSKNEARLVS